MITENEREDLTAKLVAELKGKHPEFYCNEREAEAEADVYGTVSGVKHEFAELYDEDGNPTEDVKSWFRIENFIARCRWWARECGLPERWAEIGVIAFPELDLRGLKEFV